MTTFFNSTCFHLPTLPKISYEKSPSSLAPPPTISESFSKLTEQNRVAFIPYITAGDPDLTTTAKALKLLSSCGADLIELGLPCSNPKLDGPIIQDSMRHAMANGVNLQGVISMLDEVGPQLSCPIILLSYYNSMLNQNVDYFLSALKYGGIQGLIVPDLPFEDMESLKKKTMRKNINLVLITTPTTRKQQRNAIIDATEGFLYLASRSGVTGIQNSLNFQVQFLLEELKQETSKPIAVGFGISRPEHVQQLSAWGADGVIVGSAIVKLLRESKSSDEALRMVDQFVKSLKTALP